MSCNMPSLYVYTPSFTNNTDAVNSGENYTSLLSMVTNNVTLTNIEGKYHTASFSSINCT